MTENLIRLETSVSGADLFGIGGQRQYGIDIIAKRKDGTGIEVGSCKCYQTVRAHDLGDWSEEFLSNWHTYWWDKAVRRFILVTASRNITSHALRNQIDLEKERFHALGIDYEVWGPEQIVSKLQNHRAITTRFLGPVWADILCGRIATDLEHLSVGRDLSVRISYTTAASKFRGKVKRFLQEYLESENGPVPFGGREGELAQLSDWLADSERPARLLITAPAGRGKTALLVHWISTLQENRTLEQQSATASLEVVFVPISIRAGTNHPAIFYEALASRLAEILGQTLHTTGSATSAHFSDQAAELIDLIGSVEKRILIVIDGIDEALGCQFDASIFPPRLTPNLKVLLSARLLEGDDGPRGWLQRLNWDRTARVETMGIEPIMADGIADILERMGSPLDSLSNKPSVVAKLQYLTEGEPLLLRYYAESLWTNNASNVSFGPDQLETIKPGFGGFFDRWMDLERRTWREQGLNVDQKSIDAILAVLACALGPLERQHLAELCEDIHGIKLGPSTRGSLEPLRRFVIGRGDIESGYVLSHPKIASYLRTDYLDKSTVDATVRGFVAWGHKEACRVNEQTTQPHSVPPYLLQFYGQHLDDAHAPLDVYMQMVESGWLMAWKHFEGGLGGFSADVARAWNVAKLADGINGSPVSLAHQIRCALCLVSIRNAATNIPASLCCAAVECGLMSPREAFNFTSSMADEYYVSALPRLAPHLSEPLIEEALSRAFDMDDEELHAQAMVALAPRLSLSLIIDSFLAARALKGEHRRARIYVALASRFPQHLIPAMLDAIELLVDEDWRATALVSLAPRIPKTSIDKALEIFGTLNKEHLRARCIVAIMPHLPETLRPTLVAAASKISAEPVFAETMARISQYIPVTMIGGVLLHARQVSEAVLRTRLLAALIPHLSVEVHDLIAAEGLASARSIEHGQLRARGLAELARGLSVNLRTSVLVEALQTAREVDQSERVRALCDVAAASLPELRDAILDDALDTAATLRDEDACTLAISTLAPTLGTLNHFRKSIKIVAAMQWTLAKSEALVALGPHLPVELIAEARAIATTIRQGASRERAMRSIKLDRIHNESNIAAALLAARTIGDSDERLIALVALGRYLPGKQEECFQLTKLASRKVLPDILKLTVPFALRKVLEFVLENASLADRDRANLAFVMIDELSPSQMHELLPLVSSIDDTALRAKVLDYLPEPLRTTERGKLYHASKGRFGATPNAAQFESTRRRSLATSKQTVRETDEQESHSLPAFRRFLDESDGRLRREVLKEFPAQYSLLATMSEGATLLAVWRAIKDTGEWFP
ncbi:NACHT domain-containing protein [Bradyrhizobium sp. AUGA SZCCT0431]|uniref:NACHT domain-containing protein n=1 Tax=Bradyrhizobium sp. AUGA SZCCT0431 TaxID=2807674 RepID=UPI001BAA4508|nr:NACHT domain-containing protein [Bradyrhizobium sp. AUGA SZCCT0431]MBR1146116.1 NACHT domain-containing protein [Bradyrhizobium sp. AUGA SZCCT0431]